MTDHAEPLAAWERHLCAPVSGRKVICAFEVLAGMTPLVAKLRRWGSERPLMVADGQGTGPLPGPDDADVEMLPPHASTTLTEQVRARMLPASLLTPAARAAVDRYDPAGAGLWWVPPIVPNSPLLGRPVLNGRPPGQAALEDKLVVDTMLDEIGTARSPSVVSDATYDALMRATDQVLAAAGTHDAVWAGDSRDGINGAGDFVRWVRTSDQAVEAAAFFSRHCDRVRVAPYLAGVPCSIHGIVLPDGVVVLRPVELASLLQPESGRFFFGGLGTSWDPATADADDMRRVAREFGANLRRTRGYRGAFGLDGVLTRDGFRVTELNPRFSGGISRLSGAAEDAHLDLVQVNALLGRDIGRSAADLEEDALRLLDENRFIGVAGVSVAVRATETVEVAVAVGTDRLEAADSDGDAFATVQIGPAELGAYVRMSVRRDLVPRGDRCAPLGVLMCEFADRRWGTGFGPLTVSPDVRAASPGG
jgi:hypothetical protein